MKFEINARRIRTPAASEKVRFIISPSESCLVLFSVAVEFRSNVNQSAVYDKVVQLVRKAKARFCDIFLAYPQRNVDTV